MSYSIAFKVKVQDKDIYIPVGECEANITWNVREMIVKSTGLEWKNEESNGLVIDVIPHIQMGYNNLIRSPQLYKQYEAENGWGTVEGCRRFFKDILEAWDNFINDYYTKNLIDCVYFWIE